MTSNTVKKQTSLAGLAKSVVRKQIFIPIAALLILVLFNLIADPSFFQITLQPNSEGYNVLSGNIISIIDRASELVILAIGMTLVTSASGGQDISVGATIAIAGSVVLRVLCGSNTRPDTLQAPIIVAFVVCCIVSMLFGAFNGTLVSVFNIQPMIATLILYSCGQIVLEAMLSGEVLHLPWLGFVRANQVLCAIALVTVIIICLRRLKKEERGREALICFAQVIPAIGIVVAMEFAALEKKISMIESWPADVCFLIMGLACLWMGLAVHRLWKKAYALHTGDTLVES